MVLFIAVTGVTEPLHPGVFATSNKTTKTFA
jgi:hypothetical protein